MAFDTKYMIIHYYGAVSHEEPPQVKTVAEYIAEVNKLLEEGLPLKAWDKLAACMDIHTQPTHHHEEISELGAKILTQLDTILSPEELEALRERMRSYSISQTQIVANKNHAPRTEVTQPPKVGPFYKLEFGLYCL